MGGESKRESFSFCCGAAHLEYLKLPQLPQTLRNQSLTHRLKVQSFQNFSFCCGAAKAAGAGGGAGDVGPAAAAAAVLLHLTEDPGQENNTVNTHLDGFMTCVWGLLLVLVRADLRRAGIGRGL